MKSKLVILSAVLALTVGCGGGGDSATKTPAPATGGAPAAKSGYQGGPVQNAGAIMGTVSYNGAETDRQVTITKDDATCAAHGKSVAEHSLLVAAGKLSNTVVWIEKIEAGKPFQPKATTVNNAGCMFEPRVSIGYKGSDINALNSDPVLHNTHVWREGKTVTNIALPGEGDSVQKKLKKEGLHEITCDAHEWMKAYMFVTDHPYAVVTKGDGSFSLGDVPEGSYTLKYWHERLGEMSKQVTVTAGGKADASVSFNGPGA